MRTRSLARARKLDSRSCLLNDSRRSRRRRSRLFNFRFPPAAKQPKPVALTLISARLGSSSRPYKAPRPLMMSRPDVGVSSSCLELRSDPCEAARTQRCRESSRLIMAQISRYSAAADNKLRAAPRIRAAAASGVAHRAHLLARAETPVPRTGGGGAVNAWGGAGM